MRIESGAEIVLQSTNSQASAESSNWPAWYCPVHRKPLKENRDSLICSDGDHFPIRSGMPRFVPKSNYADAFGIQWQRYRLAQLDSYTGFPVTRIRTQRCTGENLWDSLKGKQVLECGCGAGRFTEVLLGRGAFVTSLDLSEAVDANQQNFPQDKSHRVAQGDIGQLPFAPQQYDVVFCLGVLQYTSNPEKSLTSLYEQVKPGGTLVVDIYTHRLSWYTKTAPLFRHVLRHLPAEKGIRFTETLVDTLLPLHRLARNVYPMQMLLSRLSPVLCYYREYPGFSKELHREWALLDTHNALTGWYRHVRTQKQLRETLEQLGLRHIWCEYGGNGVEARGSRPL